MHARTTHLVHYHRLEIGHVRASHTHWHGDAIDIVIAAPQPILHVVLDHTGVSIRAVPSCAHEPDSVNEGLNVIGSRRFCSGESTTHQDRTPYDPTQHHTTQP